MSVFPRGFQLCQDRKGLGRNGRVSNCALDKNDLMFGFGANVKQSIIGLATKRYDS